MIKFDCFLSYDYNCNLYILERIEKVKLYLESRNICCSCCLDITQRKHPLTRISSNDDDIAHQRKAQSDEKSDSSSSILRRKMLCETIDCSQSVILFLTRSFIEDMGALRSEFGYYLRTKGRQHIILALLEHDMILTIDAWAGEIGVIMKEKNKYADFSNMDKLFFSRQCDELYYTIYDLVLPILVQQSARLHQAERGYDDKNVRDTLVDFQMDYRTIYQRLYTDLTKSTKANTNEHHERTALIVQNLSELKAAANSHQSLKILGEMDLISLIISILSLNNESSTICKAVFETLGRLCRFGLSRLTESLDNICIIIDANNTSLFLNSIFVHITNKDVVLCGFSFLINISISEHMSELLCSHGVIPLIARSLHLYSLEPEIVECIAEFITVTVKFFTSSNIEFGRLNCCFYMILALKRYPDLEPMCLSVYEALLSLMISEENRSKMRSAGAVQTTRDLRKQLDARHIALLSKTTRLLSVL